jgi:hypothetical protein
VGGEEADTRRYRRSMSFQRALLHAAKCSFIAAALVDEMVERKVPPLVDDLAGLLLRLDDVVDEAELARGEIRAIFPRDLP